MLNFMFLRPWWLLTLLLVLVELLISVRAKRNRWDLVCAPHLQPKMIYKSPSSSTGSGLIRALILLGAFAMAGPSFKTTDVPVMVDTQPLVVALDISLSMKAQDIKPSRLSRAKFIVEDLIKEAPTKPIGLIAFAEESYTIVPVTADHVALLNLLKVLDTDLVPVQGSSTALAVADAIKRLQSSRYGEGQILLITDEVTADSANTIKALVEKTDYQLITLVMATPRGAIIPSGNGFVSDNKGAAVMVKLNLESLAPLSALRNSDVIPWDHFRGTSSLLSSKKAIQEDDTMKTHINEDAGIYLLLLVLPLSALLFRRGWLIGLLIIPMMSDLEAAPWWKHQERAAMDAFDAQQYEAAAKEFKEAQWKASALYKNGNYEQSLELFKEDMAEQGLYNQGNSLAQLGRYEEARQRYEQVIQRSESLLKNGNKNVATLIDDAKYNLKVIKDKKEDPSKNKKNEPSSSDKNSDKSDESSAEKQDAKGSSKDNDKNDSKSGSDPSSENDSSKNPNDPGASNEDSGKEKPGPTDKKDAGKDNDHLKNEKDENTNDKQSQGQDHQKELEKNHANDARNEQSNLSRDPRDPRNNAALDEEEQAALDKANQQARQDKAWLDTIEDDPAELLKRKFLYQYQQAQKSKSKETPSW